MSSSEPHLSHALQGLTFINRHAALEQGPGRRFFSRTSPRPLAGSRLVHASPAAAALLGLDPQALHTPAFAEVFSGRGQLPGFDPLAMRYAGHQFGHFVPQLGDGRAIVLGEVAGPQGHWEIQLKGAGRTAYSRGGDGRAVLRSSLREYLGSEAMHALGIPTTRALALFDSDEEVYRERIERGALLVRLAPSHLRFGSFEIHYYDQDHQALRQLADHAIAQHFPELADAPRPHLALYHEVGLRTARLMAQWQLVGFVHGVMNTDNMSILGLTLDYGPYGFLDHFEHGYVCNHSDHHGRYAYDQQPDIGLWNFSCLGQALLPLLDPDPEQAVELATAGFPVYQETFKAAYAAGWRAKLGLRESRDSDLELVQRLLTLMEANTADYSLSLRALGELQVAPTAALPQPLVEQFADRDGLAAWIADYRARLQAECSDDGARRARMQAVNPRYILRNHLAQQAIAAAEAGDYGELDRLHRCLQRPYDDQPEFADYATAPPDWARGLALSCSS